MSSSGDGNRSRVSPPCGHHAHVWIKLFANQKESYDFHPDMKGHTEAKWAAIKKTNQWWRHAGMGPVSASQLWHGQGAPRAKELQLMSQWKSQMQFYDSQTF